MREKISWKAGNGAALLGISFCIISLLMCLMVFEYCNVYCGKAYTQTRADLIADGSAEYANDRGELDTEKARDMAQQLAILNAFDLSNIALAVGTRPLDANNLYDATLPYHNTIDVSFKCTESYIFSSKEFESEGNATTRIVPIE